jgi:hypothetical protein
MIAALRNELKNHEALVTRVIPANTGDSDDKWTRERS